MNAEGDLLSRSIAKWRETSGRIVIGGGPRVGKSYLGDRLEAIGIQVQRTDWLVQSHAWSEASDEIARWMAQDGPWVVDGVATVRALRKRLDAHHGKPCDLLVWMRGPRVELSPGQRSMTAGCETILAKIRPELERRHVAIMEIP